MDGGAGMAEVMWPCPWNCIEITIYLDRIIYHGCQEYLSTRPRPEVRSLFPPCLSSKVSLPTVRLWTGPATTISAYDSSQSRLGCVVLAVCLSRRFFTVFFFVAMEWGRSRWLAGSRSTANRPSAHCPTARHRQGSKKPAITLPLPASCTAPSTTSLSPTCPTAHPRLVRPLGHLHAHPIRLLRRTVPPESVLLYVR